MNIQEKITRLEKRITAIEKRNKRVESNKSWETSLTRKVAIAAITYIAMSSFFALNKSAMPLKDAIVPTLGFLLSTLSLSLVRSLWERSK